MGKFFNRLSNSIKKRNFALKMFNCFRGVTIEFRDDSVCFVVALQNKGYILDRMAKEIGKTFKLSLFHYERKNFPKVKKYFVTHYSLLQFVFREVDPEVAEVSCLFTHDKGNLDDYVSMLNCCSHVIAENQEGVDVLLKYGIRKELLSFVPECADSSQFRHVDRKQDGAVVICGTNYSDERKNPQLIKQVIAALPHRKFIFLGKDWQDFATFPNVTISKAEYRDYWSVYSQCSVYLSCSKLEGGGPNSLIEAMHTNLVPVVSDTGNARDYISHGKNGFIFSLNSDYAQVVEMVEQAYQFTPEKNNGKDVYQTVSSFTWKDYGNRVKEILLSEPAFSKKIFLRSFNDQINSKTGTPLLQGRTRGTPEWKKFENILKKSLHEVGCKVYEQLETPLEKDREEWIKIADKKIAVHKCKRDLPDYDLFYMQMHMRNLFTLDFNGWGNDHSQNLSFNADAIGAVVAQDFCEKLSNKMLTSGMSKCDQAEVLDSNLPEKFILVPLQIPRDYVLQHHSPITVLQFIEAIIAYAAAAKVDVCFKLHPFNKSDHELIKAIDDGLKSSPYIHKAEGNINDLIKKSVGLFVINSGTGFESILHGRPVATFGGCDYKVATFAGDISDLAAAKEFLFNYSEEQKIFAYKFVYWYHTIHSYDVYDESITQKRLTAYLKTFLR